MYVKSSHSRGVNTLTFLKALVYSYLIPKVGYYKRLKEKFGSNTLLLLNSELVFHNIIRLLPNKEPGMEVLLDKQFFNRFSKIISRQGLKPIKYDGQKELMKLIESSRVLMVVYPDSYSTMRPKNIKLLQLCSGVKVLYQNRKRPKEINMGQDIYIWEPKGLPRSCSGAVVSFSYTDYVIDKSIYSSLKELNLSKMRLSSSIFIREIFKALRGYENKFRRIDRRPPKILARILYDFYK